MDIEYNSQINHLLFIDDRNRTLWNTLSEKYTIKVVIERRSEYMIKGASRSYTIYAREDDISSESFTHELLHLYLWDAGVKIDTAVEHELVYHPHLNKFITAALAGHIGNCLAHVKMFERYRALGYDDSKFIQDFHEDKLHVKELLYIQKGMIKRRWWKQIYSASVIDLYIGKFFAVHACPNKKIDYAERLDSLNSVNPELFKILKWFWESWVTMPIFESKTSSRDTETLVSEFSARLFNWSKDRRIA